jgi:sec-independent protein translocase protein TatA
LRQISFKLYKILIVYICGLNNFKGMHGSGLLFLSNLFSSDMIIIVFVALLLFGGEKLPEIARGLGKGIRDFKDASEGVKREINNQINSFEEKREEDKRVEEAIVINQRAAQNQLSGANTDELVEGHPPVVNTMPLSDSIFTEDKNAPTAENGEERSDLKTENHVDAAHTGAGETMNEPIKN